MRPFKALFDSDAFAGILLIAVAVAAIGVANSPLAHAYHAMLHDTWRWSPVAKLDTLHLWINDGLMAVFFFVVGLEVKREILCGNLADARSRRLPVLAAAAGMAVPAIVYLLVARDTPQIAGGWAIPAATDIAFAMGVIGLLGNRVPAALRLFLLTVAIVDDIGAVLIIALFYTVGLDLAWLVAGVIVLAAMIALGRARVASPWPYVLGAVALWYCVLHSGVHATIAGVVAALTIPVTAHGNRPLLEDMEHAWSAGMPTWWCRCLALRMQALPWAAKRARLRWLRPCRWRLPPGSCWASRPAYSVPCGWQTKSGLPAGRTNRPGRRCGARRSCAGSASP